MRQAKGALGSAVENMARIDDISKGSGLRLTV